MSQFHFSPRPNRAHEIQWREWSDEAFHEAAATGKPVLLSLSAVWCHWCHVMDETSYSDEGVIAFINEHYIPVRVDNDQRPDINARYNMGGWPTTAFLTAEGEVLAGATYIPPDQMKEVAAPGQRPLPQQPRRGHAEGAEMRAAPRRGAGEESRGELTPAIFDQRAARASAPTTTPSTAASATHPSSRTPTPSTCCSTPTAATNDPDVLHMARKTLEFMGAGEVYDHEWGGFFRYATRRDWSEPHYEKMLEDNANLLRNAARALPHHRPATTHADIARGHIEYLEWKLRDPERGYFYGSQDADEQFYKLSKEGRERAEEPYIDRTCYTSWNAMMISAYLEASWTLDRPDLRDIALKALDFLWTRLRR